MKTVTVTRAASGVSDDAMLSAPNVKCPLHSYTRGWTPMKGSSRQGMQKHVEAKTTHNYRARSF